MEQELCYCRRFHQNCNPATCQQAGYAARESDELISLRELKVRAKQGCKTCAIVASAIDIPEIRKAWKTLIEPALKAKRWQWVKELETDEDAIEIEFDPPDVVNDRRVIRVRASHGAEDWMNFNVWNESSSESAKCKGINNLKYHPTHRTDSQESLGHLKAWIAACDQEHGCYNTARSLLPTRVLDITENMVRVATKPGHRARYTTLSHRWGQHEPLKLTLSTLDSMHIGIPWENIPKAFQDAIWLTRQLEIDYIWIDSLCIVQDDKDDWATESIRMRDVYGNSYLNIAAGHGRDSSQELFATSAVADEFPTCSVPDHAYCFVRQQPYLTHRDFGSNHHGAPRRWQLLTRGWVLQERLLAPRVVYFDTDDMKWECIKTADCQCGAIVTHWNFKVHHYDAVFRGSKPLPFEWMRIAESYSSLELTRDDDRVVALAGIALQASLSRTGGRYLAGMWEQNLAHQMCWEVVDTFRKSRTYIAPSWSWLSVFGTIRNFNRMNYYPHPSQVDVVITDVDVTTVKKTDTTGPIVSGYLKLTGLCVEMHSHLVDIGYPLQPRYPPTFSLSTTSEGQVLDGHVVMDYGMTAADANSITKVLVVFWGAIYIDRSVFMVLKPMAGQDRTYERLGLFWLDANHESEKLERDRVLGWCRLQRDITII